MICFSLSSQISTEKIIYEINKLIEKNIKCKEDADSSVLLISLNKITQVIDAEHKKITHDQTTKI